MKVVKAGEVHAEVLSQCQTKRGTLIIRTKYLRGCYMDEHILRLTVNHSLSEIDDLLLYTRQ